MLIPRLVLTKEGTPVTLSSLSKELNERGFTRTDSSDTTEIQWKKGDMELTLFKDKGWRGAIITHLKKGVREALGMQYMYEGSAIVID